MARNYYSSLKGTLGTVHGLSDAFNEVLPWKLVRGLIDTYVEVIDLSQNSSFYVF